MWHSGRDESRFHSQKANVGRVGGERGVKKEQVVVVPIVNPLCPILQPQIDGVVFLFLCHLGYVIRKRILWKTH